MNAGALAAALIEFDSRNPTLVPGAPGEGGVARFLGDVLDGWGFAVELTDVAARDAMASGLDGTVIDEEYESLGTRALLASGPMRRS